MKTNVLKSLVLTVALVAPLAFVTQSASGSDRHSRSNWSVSYSSGHSYGRGHHYSGSHYSHYSPSRYSHYSPSYYSRSYYPHSYYPRSYYPRRSTTYINVGSGYYGDGYYSSLPLGCSPYVFGGVNYYRSGSRYYRPYESGYILVGDPHISTRSYEPVVVKRSVSSKYSDYPRIWVDGSEYLIDEGDLFLITSQGLVWAELPLGSVATSLPTHATSVWFKEVEYFEAGGVYFQRIPEGYRMILPPWEGEY